MHTNRHSPQLKSRSICEAGLGFRAQPSQTGSESRFVEAIGFSDVSNESGTHRTDGDDRIGPKVDALTGCHLLFVLAIGGPAAARVVNAHVHPVKLPKEETIEAIISRVQTMMSGNPPPWLRKVMGAQAERSMDFLDEE
jgi:nitrogen fixation protein NifX